MPDQLQTIVQRMIDAGEPESNIAAVIQHVRQTAPKSNTGMSTADLQAANLKGRDDLPSAGGFLGNVASSGGKFVTDAVSGIPGIMKLLAAAVDPTPMGTVRRGEALTHAPEIAKAAGQGLKQRYGGIDETLSTAYHDPVGMAADMSTVAGGAGLAAKAGNAPRMARVLSSVSEATNPARMFEPIAKGIEYGMAGAVRPMLKPSKILRRQQTEPLEIERTALKTGAVTGGLAKSQQKAAVNRATTAAASSTATTPRGRIVNMPKALSEAEEGLSHDSDIAALAQVERDAMRSLEPEVSASDLLTKRRHLDRELNNAFRSAERGGAPVGIKQSGQKEMLGNIRAELRAAAPGIAAEDATARSLGLVRGAIADAGLRAGDIPMGAALLGGGLTLAGVPGASAAGALFGMGRTFPQIPLALGSIPVRGAALAATPAGQKSALVAALIARLSGDGESESNR